MFFKGEISKKDQERKARVKPENQVILLVWKPKIDQEDAGALEVIKEVREAHREGRRADINIGHVAMATPNKYISIWPTPGARGGQFEVRDAKYCTLDDDLKNEGGKPDTVVTLYSLDTHAMEEAFKDIEASEDGFVLAGDKVLVRMGNDRQGRNCNGFVYELLRLGGVGDVTPKSADWSFSLYISPDRFDPYIKAVKAQEVTLYSKTADYKKVPGEYQPSPPEDSSSNPSVGSEFSME